MVKTAQKRLDFLSLSIVFLTVAVSILCLYDLYQLFKPIQDINQVTLTKAIYSVFLVGLWVACWWSLFYGVIALHLYIKTRRIIGPISSETRRIITLLCTISRMARTVTGSRHLSFYAGLISILAAFVFANWRLLFIFQLVVVVQVWLWVRISTPPIVVLLSSSHPKCIKRHGVYKHLISPLRIISLLDFNEAYTGYEAELHLDCLRATNGKDWMKEIPILLDFAPFIIIDASIVSDGVLEEAKYILSSSLTYKSIFLPDSQGKFPLLDKIPSEQPIDFTQLLVISEEGAIELVNKLIVQNTFPTQGNPLKG